MSRNLRTSLTAVGSCLGVYVVIAVGFHSVTSPAVVAHYGAVSKPWPAPAAMVSDAQIVNPRAPDEAPPLKPLPLTFARASSTTPIVTKAAPPATAEKPDAAQQGAVTKKHAVRATSHRERQARERRGFWDFAFGPSYGTRRWF